MSFKLSVGSVIGTYHQSMYINNQDAFSYSVYSSPDGKFNQIIGIVSDGCGSGKHSDFGSKVVSTMLLNFLKGTKVIKEDDEETEYFLVHTLGARLYRWYVSLLGNLGFDHKDYEEELQFVYSHLLSTFVGFVIEDDKTVIFSSGDGVYVVNDEVTVIDQDNMPAYFMYKLVAHLKNQISVNKDFDIQVNKILPTKELRNLIVATDGAEHIIYHADEEYKMFNKVKKVGDLTQFITEPIYRNNTRAVNKRLNVLLNKKYLGDDTTLIVVNRDLQVLDGGKVEDNAGTNTGE